MNRCLEDLSAQFEQLGAHYEVIDHPEAFSAQEEAEAAHVPGMSFAKPVVIMAGQEPYLLVVPAPKQVDLRKVARTLDSRPVRLAEEREMAPLFPDCEVGAMPPFPGPNAVPVVVEESLTVQKEVAFEAGSHHEAIKMSTADYLRIASPRIARFAAAETGRPSALKRGVLAFSATAVTVSVAAIVAAALLRRRQRSQRPLDRVRSAVVDARPAWLLLAVSGLATGALVARLIRATTTRTSKEVRRSPAPRTSPSPARDVPPGELGIESEQRLGALMGMRASALDGEGLGRVTAVYFDEPTGTPEWAEVGAGGLSDDLFLVPLAESKVDEEELKVPYPKELIESAPRLVGVGMTVAAEMTLCEHYNRRRTVPSALNEDPGDYRLSRWGPLPAPPTPPELGSENWTAES